MHLEKFKNRQAILDCLDQIHNRMYDIEESLADDNNHEITSLRLDVLSLLESSIHFYVRKKPLICGSKTA